MKRTDFLKALCAAPVAALSACSTTSAPVAPGNGQQWPPVAFSSVRAFVYDCEAELRNMSFLKNGRMHTGVINAPGALLNADQTTRLLAILNTPSTREKYKPCYVPHHAIVFYDAAGQPVANIEICFTCSRHIATPGGNPDIINYGALWSLMHELGVPAQRGEGYYRELYRQKRGGN